MFNNVSMMDFIKDARTMIVIKNVYIKAVNSPEELSRKDHCQSKTMMVYIFILHSL